MTTNKKLCIGLFGFGVVGEGIYKVLQQTPSLNANIKKICIKDSNKKREAPLELFTTSADVLLNDASINVIVELIDDADAAYKIVKTALKNGKHVVSANKKMVAEHLSELQKLQQENNVSLLYEAAVCGSIPVIRNLEEYYDNDLLNSFSGIINGSTNFILTKMKEEYLSYDTALKQAQDLGFAESNPDLDVKGKDAVNKLTIVLKHAYGLSVDPQKISHKGIDQLHYTDTKYANEKGYCIKLVAYAKQIQETKIVAFVFPTFVNSNSQLYHIRNEFNGALLGSKLADEQFLYGKGAGRYPTSSAILSDISALRYNYKYEYKKSNSNNKFELTDKYILKIFVSYDATNIVEISDFLNIDETFISTNRNHIIGDILLSKLQDASWFNNKNISIIVMGDSVINSNYETAEIETMQLQSLNA